MNYTKYIIVYSNGSFEFEHFKRTIPDINYYGNGTKCYKVVEELKFEDLVDMSKVKKIWEQTEGY